MEHGLVVSRLLLPANQNPALPVKPTVSSLHDPAAGLESLLFLERDLFFAPTANVRCKSVPSEPMPDPFRVVGLVQTHAVRIFARGLGHRNWNAPDRIDHKSRVVLVGWCEKNSDGNSCRIGQNASFRPLFASICRVFACFFSPANGAFAKLVSSESHFQLIPLASSYFCSSFFQKAWKTPARRHC